MARHSFTDIATEQQIWTSWKEQKRWEPNRSGLVSWSSSRSGRVFQAEANDAAFDPAVIAEWETALNAVTHGCEFRLGLWLVDPRAPHSRQRRVIGEGQPAALVGGLLSSGGGTPLPGFRAVREIRPHRISFDVPHDRQQVLVDLNRERFESGTI